MKTEGKNSPADVFLTVDAGNLWLAEKDNLFQPAQSKMLDERIPASLKNPKNLWFGFSTRARLIFVNAKRVDPKLVQTYESLADPRLKGKICMRSSLGGLQSLADGRADRALGTGEGGTMGEGRGGEFRTGPARRRHDAAAKRRGRRVRGHARQSLLLHAARDLEGRSRAGDAAKALTLDLPGSGRRRHACERVGRRRAWRPRRTRRSR